MNGLMSLSLMYWLSSSHSAFSQCGQTSLQLQQNKSEPFAVATVKEITMNKYVKNPIEITAIQYQWTDEPGNSQDEVQDKIAEFVNQDIELVDDVIYLDGVHGQVEVKQGDWVIKQNDQDFYPCSDEVFQQNYTAAPSTWLDRVKLEQERVQKDLSALDKTLDVERKPDFITDEQWIFMTRQQFHMRQYNQILKDRIANAV